eukprot:scaffold318_cov396-Prasinococcus_capsulatus_cf.AAC.6
MSAHGGVCSAAAPAPRNRRRSTGVVTAGLSPRRSTAAACSPSSRVAAGVGVVTCPEPMGMRPGAFSKLQESDRTRSNCAPRADASLRRFMRALSAPASRGCDCASSATSPWRRSHWALCRRGFLSPVTIARRHREAPTERVGQSQTLLSTLQMHRRPK